MQSIEELSILLSKMSQKEINNFLHEILTDSEISDLSKRWRILKLLDRNFTQRDVAKELGVSLCKVTRGAKILKNSNAITRKMIKEMKDEQTS